MEDLFSTRLDVDKQNINFHVVFDKEKYLFKPESNKSGVREFYLKRQDDRWITEASLSADLKKQAIDNLEQYLLKQH